MGSRWLWPTLTLLLVTGLSGCFGGDETVKVDEEDAAAPDAVVTDATGSINGAVVGEDFSPLPKIGVTVTKQGRLVDETATDKDGRYTVNDLSPDTYVLQTLAPGYEQKAVQVEVLAGKVTKKDLQLRSLAELSNESYVVPDDWTGFIGCSIGAGRPGLGAAYSACSNSAQNVSVDPNDDFLHIFEVEKGLKDLVVGITWTKSGGVSADQLLLIVEMELVDADGDREWRSWRSGQGPSPILLTINDEYLKERDDTGNIQFETIDDTTRVRFRVFAPLATPPVIVYQQPFTVYWDQFYGVERAPEGHSPIPDT